MAKITAKSIIERHNQFPGATEQLIEQYAFMEYKKSIDDLMTYAKIVKVENTDTTLIVLSDSDFKNWKDLTNSHWYLNDSVHLK